MGKHFLLLITHPSCYSYIHVKSRKGFGSDGGGRRCRIVVGFITIYAISAYHHRRYEFETRSSEVY
jgi:hypothetical protein